MIASNGSITIVDATESGATLTCEDVKIVRSDALTDAFEISYGLRPNVTQCVYYLKAIDCMIDPHWMTAELLRSNASNQSKPKNRFTPPEDRRWPDGSRRKK